MILKIKFMFFLFDDSSNLIMIDFSGVGMEKRANKFQFKRTDFRMG